MGKIARISQYTFPFNENINNNNKINIVGDSRSLAHKIDKREPELEVREEALALTCVQSARTRNSAALVQSSTLRQTFFFFLLFLSLFFFLPTNLIVYLSLSLSLALLLFFSGVSSSIFLSLSTFLSFTVQNLRGFFRCYYVRIVVFLRFQPTDRPFLNLIIILMVLHQ